ATRQANAAGVRAFVEGRYGFSIHWGLYSLLGRHEWAMHLESIPHARYFELMKKFNPTRFNAEEWADLMLEAGQKFLLITTKHHDGFCLWDTALTDNKVTNTPFRRDPLAELAVALRDRGLQLHFYHSLMDWTHPAYRNDWPEYLAYLNGQLRELLTNYGPIHGVLFDGYWPRQRCTEGDAYLKEAGPYDLAGLYDLIHELQPSAMVTNNHHVLPLKGEDSQVWEFDMPGQNTYGCNTTEIGTLPLAVWWTLNQGWSYQPGNHRIKSADTILTTLRQAQSRNATFMLNVGPRSFGDIHPEEQFVLRQIGTTLRDLAL
ncbi:MAG: alpha-L-fucosidase, partial [Planctomycetes bacterium]|nr:alpha-L-fucosidase [Planctomycetota bacterium]